jgi:hypothetical protein
MRDRAPQVTASQNLEVVSDVDEVTGEGQAEQCDENSNEINDKTSRLEPSGLQLSARAAVAKQAGQGQYDARDDRDGAEPNRKPRRR